MLITCVPQWEPCARKGCCIDKLTAVQGDGDELVLFPGLNAPAPAGATAAAWDAAGDATADGSACTVRGRSHWSRAC